MKSIVLSILLMLCTTVACSTSTWEGRGMTENGLHPCPKSPNCVSSRSDDPKHAMAALPYVGTRRESLDRLIQILRDMKRCTLVTTAPDYPCGISIRRLSLWG